MNRETLSHAVQQVWRVAYFEGFQYGLVLGLAVGVVACVAISLVVVLLVWAARPDAVVDAEPEPAAKPEPTVDRWWDGYGVDPDLERLWRDPS
jgi:hypothetical protein